MSETFIDGMPAPDEQPQTSLYEVMQECRERYDREVDEFEIPIVGRLVEAGRSLEEILEYLKDRVHIPSDEELETVRYEATGEGVVPIPDVVPDE